MTGRYAAPVRPAICSTQETHCRFCRRQLGRQPPRQTGGHGRRQPTVQVMVPPWAAVGAIQSDAAMLSIRESREAWHMAAAKLSDEAFSAILEAHPGLRERFASIAMAVANSGENLKEADAIEERIVEEMRLLGREAMQGWAETQVEATEKEIRQQPSMHRQGKKNSAGIRNLAKSRF